MRWPASAIALTLGGCASTPHDDEQLVTLPQQAPFAVAAAPEVVPAAAKPHPVDEVKDVGCIETTVAKPGGTAMLMVRLAEDEDVEVGEWFSCLRRGKEPMAPCLAEAELEGRIRAACPQSRRERTRRTDGVLEWACSSNPADSGLCWAEMSDCANFADGAENCVLATHVSCIDLPSVSDGAPMYYEGCYETLEACEAGRRMSGPTAKGRPLVDPPVSRCHPVP